eukprot:TRINITY_DN17166_c0_g1_i2.p1 TRINITY_DN17166_c0_g1~~TRINITY_DN17166_c0_g1_i2.p1  ORF type:complete len:1158 (+),score=210.48 TRINITY_DN17166_c0_g1_i2:128-3601(+)
MVVIAGGPDPPTSSSPRTQKKRKRKRTRSSSPVSPQHTGKASTKTPNVLWVAVPRCYGPLTGEYCIVANHQVNGRPVWCNAQGDRPYWIYSDPDEGWSVTDNQTAFATGGGLLTSTHRHHGVLPHKVKVWSVGDGTGWRPCPGVQVSATQLRRQGPAEERRQSVPTTPDWSWQSRPQPRAVAMPFDGFGVEYPRGYDGGCRLTLRELKRLKRVYEQEARQLLHCDAVSLKSVLQSIGIGVHVDLKDLEHALTEARRLARQAASSTVLMQREDGMLKGVETGKRRRSTMQRVVPSSPKSPRSGDGESLPASPPTEPTGWLQMKKKTVITSFRTGRGRRNSVSNDGERRRSRVKSSEWQPFMTPVVSGAPAPPVEPVVRAPGACEAQQPLSLTEFFMLCDVLKATTQSAGDGQVGDQDTLDAFVAMGGDRAKAGEVAMDKLRSTTAEFQLALDEGVLDEIDRNQSGTVDFREFASLLSFDAAGDAIDCFTMAGGDPGDRGSRVCLLRLEEALDMLADTGAVPGSPSNVARALSAVRSQGKKVLDFVEFITTVWQPAIGGGDRAGERAQRGSRRESRQFSFHDLNSSVSGPDGRRQTVQRARDASRAVAALLRKRQSQYKPTTEELHSDVLLRRFYQLCRRLQVSAAPLSCPQDVRETGLQSGGLSASSECTLMRGGLSHFLHINAQTVHRFIVLCQAKGELIKRRNAQSRRNSAVDPSSETASDASCEGHVAKQHLLFALTKAVALCEDHDRLCPVCSPRVELEDMGYRPPGAGESIARNTGTGTTDSSSRRKVVRLPSAPRSDRKERPARKSEFAPAVMPPAGRARVYDTVPRAANAATACPAVASLQPVPVYVTASGAAVPVAAPTTVRSQPLTPRPPAGAAAATPSVGSAHCSAAGRSFLSRRADACGQTRLRRARRAPSTGGGLADRSPSPVDLSPTARHALTLLRDTCEEPSETTEQLSVPRKTGSVAATADQDVDEGGDASASPEAAESGAASPEAAAESASSGAPSAQSPNIPKDGVMERVLVHFPDAVFRTPHSLGLYFSRRGMVLIGVNQSSPFSRQGLSRYVGCRLMSAAGTPVPTPPALAAVAAEAEGGLVELSFLRQPSAMAKARDRRREVLQLLSAGQAPPAETTLRLLRTFDSGDRRRQGGGGRS